jgi:catechol 2,3-dioxygenase-like lactoylglutathione lyase family enzyme
MTSLALHHISLAVRDLVVSAAFYEGIFNFRRLPRPDFGIAGVWFACGDRQVHLIDNASGTFRSKPTIQIADVHFAFWTDDFEGMVARLKQKGFSETAAEGDPMRLLVSRDGPAGFPQLYLLDPDFHIIEVNSAPT